MLHPATLLTILFVGVLIIGWTFLVAADSYGVTAKVAAPALTDGAIVTEPSDGDVFTAAPIAVLGSCPSNSYVNLIRNGTFSGAAWCVSNTFSIQTTLSAGANTLQAQDYNITDDPGPVTTSIAVTYNPPAASPAAPNPPSSAPHTYSSAPMAPLSLASDYHYQAFVTGSGTSWTLAISGGRPPYSVHTDWGDGQQTHQVQPEAGDITVTHTYTKPGYYPLKVTITDALGAATLLQLAALVHLPGVSSFGLGTSSSNPGSSGLGSLFTEFLKTSAWLWVAWPSYLILVLMAVSFWLGEQQELHRLLAKSSLHTPGPHGR